MGSRQSSREASWSASCPTKKPPLQETGGGDGGLSCPEPSHLEAIDGNIALRRIPILFSARRKASSSSTPPTSPILPLKWHTGSDEETLSARRGY
jgi:hypothetical protein